MKKGLTDRGKALSLGLFSRYERHISIRILLEYTLGPYPLRSVVHFYKFTGLHCASVFGLVELVGALIKMDGIDINDRDEISDTPLLWAAKSGHGALV